MAVYGEVRVSNTVGRYTARRAATKAFCSAISSGWSERSLEEEEASGPTAREAEEISG